MQLTLLVPELLWPEPGAQAAFEDIATPALVRLLAAGDLTRSPRQSFEAVVSGLFGQDGTTACAIFRRLGEAETIEDLPDASSDDASCWLCCDPVHLRFEQDSLILADAGRMAIAADEAAALAAALNEALADRGRFVMSAPERGYLRLAAGKAPPDFTALPLTAVAGRRIEHLLAEAHGDWRAVFNDIQILLHEHPVNRQRQADGRLPINAFWLWGAGCLPAAGHAVFDAVWSDNPLARGLAISAGIAAHPLPADGAAWLARSAPKAPDSRHLIVLENLLAAVQYEDVAAYRDILDALEQRWFAPLQQGLFSGRPDRLSLVAPGVYGTLHWASRPRDRWKFWRHRTSLAEWAENLANGER